MASEVKYVEVIKYLYGGLSNNGLTSFVPDKLHLSLMLKLMANESMDWNNPRTFNQKIQWLKVNDRNPKYIDLADKCLAKSIVGSQIGFDYIIPMYGKWKRVDDIDINSLPDRFVLKTNHDCGGVVICRNRSSFDWPSARRKLMKHLSNNYYYAGREWPYKNIDRCVFAEALIDANGADLADYKLFCFSNGRIITLVCTDRFAPSGMKKTFFDEKWRQLDIREGGHESDGSIPEPDHFGLMKKLASRLSNGIPFARIDFYDLAGKLYFGEMTFYPNSGFECFSPDDINEQFGSWIDLSLAFCNKPS